MRIAVLDTVYPAFLETFYGQTPGLRDRPYDDQLRALLDYSFGTSDAYTEGLRGLGWDTANLITNAMPLQLAWVRRSGLRRLLRTTEPLPGRIGGGARHYIGQAIASAQIDAFDPGVVFVHDSWSIEPRLLQRWRKQGRFLVTQIASVPPPIERVRKFDLVLSSFQHFVERFRAAGIDAEFFPLAFHPAVLDRLRAAGVDPAPDAERPRPIVFVGGVDPAVYETTTPALERAAAELPLELWGYGADRLGPESAAHARWRGEAWGLDMYRILASSKVVLNRHGTIAEGQANNMRLYEATGAGALLLTDAARALDDLFDVGREVVTYDDGDDLVEKARHYLANEDERIAIARAGQERTLREHTYTARMRELDGFLQARLSPAISSSQSAYAPTIDSEE